MNQLATLDTTANKFVLNNVSQGIIYFYLFGCQSRFFFIF